MFYLTYYIMGILVLPGLIYAIIVQAKVHNAFNTYKTVHSSKGYTAKDACKIILTRAGITDVEIKAISGNLTDNYNPKTKTLSLSESVYNSTSISALGVAAHEAGHAIQHADGYAFLKIRSSLVVVSNICSTLLWPLIIIGMIFSFGAYTSLGDVFLWAGVIFFGVSVVLSLVTLPVEFNASSRALTCLVDSGALDTTEVKGAKVVLNAAAQTYVASLVVSILYFIRFIASILIYRE
ncbi:MAG: zinc metallopeptidase [Clostridia bacterium]|nr:zinc metallopeptidase [Clostridia bacterium]